MDRIPCAPNDDYAVWILHHQQLHGQGIEELKHLLFCATLELDRERELAETQRQIQEAKLLRLQELLTVTRRERDEAREQLQKLNHRLTEMLTNTQHHVMSSDRSQWQDNRLTAAEPDELNPLNPSTTTTTTVTAAVMHSNSSPLVGLAEQFRWNSTGHHFDLAHFDLRPDVELHQPPTSSSKVHCSNLSELQEQPFYYHNEQHLPSFVERQETEQQQQEVEFHLSPYIEDKSTDHYDYWQHQPQQEAAAAGIRQPSNLFQGITESSAGSHMTYQDPKPGLVLTSSPPYLGSTPAVMPAHLPEPPESDLEVMLSTLPERGKLLQAVMQAGPLLQTLLLAGPLPQWRHPPPPRDTVEIPRISMCPSSNSLPVGPVVHHLPRPHSPTSGMDLQVSSPVSSSHQCLSPPTRINEPPSATFITSQQSVSEAASSSSKFFRIPMFTSQDSPITAGPPPKFAKIH